MVEFRVPDIGTDQESEAQSEYQNSDLDITDLFEENMANLMQGVDPMAQQQQQSTDPAELMQNLQALDPNDTAGRAQALDAIIAQILHQRVLDRNIIDQQTQTIRNLTTQLQNAQGQQGQPPAAQGQQRGPREKEPGEIIKPPLPAQFNGDPRKIEEFFTDMRAYFRHFPTTMAPDERRVSVAGSRLIEAPKNWFEPHLRDFEKNDPDARKTFTKALFGNYNTFETELKQLCGHIDEKKEAENALLKLRQQSACTKYTAEFIRICAKTELEDASKRMLYYQGLKSEVKDELARDDLPATFEALSKKASRIDDRQFERRKERQAEKGGNDKTHRKLQYHANQSKKRDMASYNDGKPGPMDLDTINTRKFTGKCNHCGKTGHKEKDCWGKHGKPNNLRESTKKIEKTEKIRIDTIDTVPHNLLSWTACYDDQCPMHKSEKEGSGWFPKAPKRKQPKQITIATITFQEASEKNEINKAIDNIPIAITSPEPTEEEKEREQRILFELGEQTRQERLEAQETASYEENHGIKRNPRNDETPTGFQQMLRDAGITQRQVPSSDGLAERANTNPYYPIMTRDQFLEWEEAQLQHDTPFTENCKRSSTQQCNKHLCTQHWETKVLDWHFWIQHGNLYNESCRQNDPENCLNRLCNQHLDYKVEEWHDRKESATCPITNPLQCHNKECAKHRVEKEEYNDLRRRLCRQGFNFETHDKRYAYRRDIIRFHEFHIDEITTNKCQWCRKLRRQQAKRWWSNDLDAIHEDALTYNITERDRSPKKIHVDTVKTTGMRKLRIDAQLANSTVTAYIDSGADRNLISTQTIKDLQIPVQRKARALQVMSVMGTEVGNGLIEYETDHLQLTINGRTHEVQFSVLDMPNCDILLGYPWLIDNDPIIRWKTNQVYWDIKDVPEY
jgi:hypothetical protein